MKALFVLWRLFVLGMCAFGLTRSSSMGLSLLLFFGAVYLACDTARVLAETRGRG